LAVLHKILHTIRAMLLSKLVVFALLGSAEAFKKNAAPHFSLGAKLHAAVHPKYQNAVRGRVLDAHDSPCGQAMMSITAACEMGEGDDDEFDFSVCENSDCTDAMSSLESDCAGTEMEETANMMGMMCDPCMTAMIGMGLACDDGESMCDGPCSEVVSMITSSECKSNVLAMMAMDDDGDADEAEAMLDMYPTMLEMMCSDCAVQQSALGDLCPEGDEGDPCDTDAYPNCMQGAVNTREACEGFDFAAMDEMQATVDDEFDADDDSSTGTMTDITEGLASCEAAGTTIPESTFVPTEPATDSTDSSAASAVFSLAAMAAAVFM